MQQVSPLATVVICTRNRRRSLSRTLESIHSSSSAATDPWELVVVDNGSDDDTASEVLGWSGRLPVRLVTEPNAGLSNARNAGVGAARGRFIIWTDDDVLVDRGWLPHWLRALRANPDVAVFGGRAVPRYEEPGQAWFKAVEPELASLLAIRDNPAWREVTAQRVPYGLNYAVRTEEQRRNPYDPALGVAPGRRVGGEETKVIRQIIAESGNGLWVWDATVYHLIAPQRQTRDYIQSYYRSLGYSFPQPSRSRGGAGTVESVGRSLLALARGTVGGWIAAVMSDPHQQMRWLVRRHRAIGSLYQLFGRAP